MIHTVSWECAWCRKRYCSVAGSKFRIKGGYKRRKCVMCIAKEMEK